MSQIVPAPARVWWASALAVAATVLAGVSAHRWYRSVQPPVEVYDNERMLVAVLYGCLTLVFAGASLVVGWSGRAPAVHASRLLAGLAMAYVAVLVFKWAS